MKKPTLVIMAAGMGSRFGGLKQIEPVSDKGEIILDFSLYDAVMAGFKKAIYRSPGKSDTGQQLDPVARKCREKHDSKGGRAVWQQPFEDSDGIGTKPANFISPDGKIQYKTSRIKPRHEIKMDTSNNHRAYRMHIDRYRLLLFPR